MSDSAYSEPSRATAVLLVGLVSFLFVQVLAPVAWVMANQELSGIERGRRSPAGRKDARVGQILGILGTVFLACGWVLLVSHLLGIFDL